MRTSVRVLLIAVVAASAGLTAAPAATAALVTPADLSIRTGTIAVHTANHQSWKMSIGAAEDGGSSADPDSVTYELSESLVRSVTKPSRSIELHVWSVGALPESTLSFDPASGDGALTTPSSTAHLTTVNLAVDNQCEVTPAPSLNRCAKVMEFESAYQQQHVLFGLTSGALTQVSFAHVVRLKHPVDAGREDGVVSAVPAPVFDKGAKTLRVFGTKSGALTGSATLMRGTLKTTTQKCTVKSVKHTETIYADKNATVSNTKGHPLVGHSALTGKLKIPNGARAVYLVATWT